MAVTATPRLYDSWEVAAALRSAAAGADLVVMATRGRGPLGRLWHGSVTHDLVRHVRTPVLLVRGCEVRPTLGGEPAVRRVLVAFDGAPEAEHVVGPAADLATVLGAEVTLLGALPFRYANGPGLAAYRAGRSPRPTDPRLPRAVYEALKSWADRLAARGLGVETRVVFDDRSVAAVVRDFARRRPADLIALTGRRPGGLVRRLFGSTADRVVRRASVPVLVSCPDKD
jgi:nucleotide-binding universal stress UspA family protein